MKLRPTTRRWYSPGLGLKRWAALAGVAIALIIIGLWSMVNNQTAKNLVVSFVNFLQRSIPDLSVGQGLICVTLGIVAVAFSVRHFSDQYSKITKGHSQLDAYLQDEMLASGPKIVVIGGGAIATRRVKTLLSFEPQIVVVAPEVTGELEELEKEEKITIFHRKYQREDIYDAWMVLAATNDPAFARSFDRTLTLENGTLQ